MIGLWKRTLETARKTTDPVLAVWRSFAALPQGDFTARADDACTAN